MKNSKPDLLFILTLVLIVGFVVTSFGGSILRSLDVQAKPRHLSSYSNNSTHK